MSEKAVLAEAAAALSIAACEHAASPHLDVLYIGIDE
jgi:hypothetical protein